MERAKKQVFSVHLCHHIAHKQKFKRERQTKGNRHLKGCKTLKSAKKLGSFGKRIAFNSFSLISRHQWKQGWVNEKYQRWSCREDARCYCIWKLTKTIEWEFYLREWIWKEGRRRRCGGKLRHLLQRSLHLPPDLHFSSTCRLLLLLLLQKIPKDFCICCTYLLHWGWNILVNKIWSPSPESWTTSPCWCSRRDRTSGYLLWFTQKTT